MTDREPSLFPVHGAVPGGWRSEIEKAHGCFDAAIFEGLIDRLSEADVTDVGSLADLVYRRLLPAHAHLQTVLAFSTAPSPPAQGQGQPPGGLTQVARYALAVALKHMRFDARTSISFDEYQCAVKQVSAALASAPPAQGEAK